MKKTFENFKDEKFASLEADQLNAIKGGRKAGGYTLNTVTVTPSGGSDDGKDSEDDISQVAADVARA